MKILITGASGYVGSLIYTYLKEAGLEVVGTYLSTKLFDDLILCNLTNSGEVINLFNKYKPDVVIHIAANASNASCEENPESATKLNVDATKYIVEESKNHNSKFIFVSSLAANNPRGVYGETKEKAEKLVTTLNSYVILRPSLIIGVSPNTKNDRPFNRFVSDIEIASSLVEYDDSWKFYVTFLSHLSEICLEIIKNNKYANTIIPVVTNKITSRYALAKDIFTEFNIKVNPVNKNAQSSQPELDWDIYAKLNLPIKSYAKGISEIIYDLKNKFLKSE